MNKSQELTIAFIGNPNCGKTTLFNAYTGANLKVANWPGVTVEKVEGAIRKHDATIHLVDLPGTYSLTSYTMEEKVSRDFILSDEVDVIVDVVDASCLQRNLYLALQLIELNRPLVLAFNMMDIVEKRGMEIDFHRLSDMLGVPCIPVSARKRNGLDILLHNCLHHQSLNHDGHELRHRYIPYSEDVKSKIDTVYHLIEKRYSVSDPYWIALKTCENDAQIKQMYPLDVDQSYNLENEIINQKYDYIETIVDEVVMNKAKKEEFTAKVDHLLTSKIWGLPCFLFIMAIVFFLTFTIGDWLKGYFEVVLEYGINFITELLTSIQITPWLIALISDGILNGVGTILTFLPNIIILFIALALLEDSGYMARVAYVMDGIMGKIGLSGRAFIPMILGFGCTVPAIMASRTLEQVKDRKRVMLVTPFMSCSARLPVYILFASVFFENYAGLVAFLMYVLGMVVVIVACYIMHRLDPSHQESPLFIELPDYKAPSAFTVYVYVWEKVKDYLRKAGTTIFIASIVMWIIMNVGINGFTSDVSQSFGAIIGQWLTFLFIPIGLGFWQIVLALIAGISAKEVVVSSVAVLFSINNINSLDGAVYFTQSLANIGFTSVNAIALMVFVLLYIPCIATLATIKKEAGTKFMWISTGFQLLVAYGVTFVVYQLANLLV